MPFVFTPLDANVSRCTSGRSDPTTATTPVYVKKLAETDAKVAAPPRIFSSVLKGVRVVSKAIVPNTESKFWGIELAKG